jgi:ABC-type multidrug transport system fused ATPase/permease subunit
MMSNLLFHSISSLTVNRFNFPLVLFSLEKFSICIFHYYLFPLAFALYSSIFLMWIAGLKASVLLHGSLLSNILRGPMNFYDTTPTGRIIARFSHDVNTCDERLINNLKQFINTFFRVRLHFDLFVLAISAGDKYFS